MEIMKSSEVNILRHLHCSSKAVFLVGIVLLAGCSGRPGRVSPPSIDAEDAAAQAMSTFDKNSDGFIADKELISAPALNAALKQLDEDGDGKVSEEEIVKRIRAWSESKIGIMSISCNVVMDSRPLEGVEVIFEPEPYLGNNVKPAVGITDRFGSTNMSVLKENRPTPESPAGVQFGLYKVRITQKSGSKSVPEKYNTKTTLGQEISYQDRGVQSQIVYRLKSR